MPLPAELVDHIFSFLREDISALKACLKTHPFLSQIAERYVYAHIIVDMDDGLAISEQYKQLSTKPHILHYPHTLEISFHCGLPYSPVLKQEMLSIIEIIPRMANLKSLKFSNLRVSKESGFLPAIRQCLQKSSVEQLCLSKFFDFPFGVLDKAKNIKKLTLSDCPVKEGRTKKRFKSSLSPETLIIHGLHNLDFWEMGRFTNLTSLQLPDVQSHRDWIGLPELLAACSNSLRRLHVGESDPLNTYTSSSDHSYDEWEEHRRYPFTLSAHKHLKQLSISAFVVVKDTMDPDVILFRCSLPAIISLVKTAPTIQDVVLRFSWDRRESDIHCLGRFDWSLLSLLESDSAGNYPRIRLCISTANEHRTIASESILNALLENEALRDFVNRGLVVLKPELDCKKPWELRDFLDF